MGAHTGEIELSNLKIDPTEQAKLRRRRRRRACCACCTACFILLILIVVILLILYFTVFKPKKPRIHVDRITLEDFDARIRLNLPPSVKLNVTLGVVASVKNPNKVSFQFHNSTAYMFYRDEEVGIVPIASGVMGAGKTNQISSSLTLLADRLITDRHLLSDFLAGSLPFSTRMDVSGRVNILNLFKHHVDTSVVCNVTISVQNPTKDLDNMVCEYDIDL